jgi:hypothetical protein
MHAYLGNYDVDQLWDVCVGFSGEEVVLEDALKPLQMIVSVPLQMQHL